MWLSQRLTPRSIPAKYESFQLRFDAPEEMNTTISFQFIPVVFSLTNRTLRPNFTSFDVDTPLVGEFNSVPIVLPKGSGDITIPIPSDKGCLFFLT